MVSTTDTIPVALAEDRPGHNGRSTRGTTNASGVQRRTRGGLDRGVPRYRGADPLPGRRRDHRPRRGSAPAGAANPAPLLYEIDYGANAINVLPASASGAVTPTVTVSDNSNSLEGPVGSAFDAAGNLWVGNLNGTSIAEFTPSQLASSGSPVPAIVISGLTAPSAVAFDSSGDLWVTTGTGIDEFTPDQVTSSGSPTPTVVISGAADGSVGLTFDAAGNLWVGNYDSSNSVLEYTPEQLTASGSPTPAVTLSGLTTPVLPTFDAKGDLWVAEHNGTGVVEFTPDQLTTSGSPTPAVSLGGFVEPSGLTFDTAGDLWVANGGVFASGGQALLEFTPGQLTTSGSPTPANSVTSTTFGFPSDVLIAEPPVVTSMSPAAGGSGTSVTINGAGFLPGASVDFGGVAATSAIYITPYELRAVAPAGFGTVDVTVSTFGGTSALSQSDRFAYTASGYWEVASDGGIFSYNAPFFGSMGGQPLNAPVVGMAATASGHGYWEVASDGGIFSYDAPFFGSMGGRALQAPVVGMAVDAATGGYWEVASDGGVFAFNAPYFGSMGGQPLNAAIVGMAAAPGGNGYWLVGKDGGIFGFGPGVLFVGSQGGKHLNAPVVGMVGDPVTSGYWEVASDGGVFDFGAPFLGSMGGQFLNVPMVGIAALPGGSGYWEVASDGGIFAYDAPFVGSMGGKHLNARRSWGSACPDAGCAGRQPRQQAADRVRPTRLTHRPSR